MAVKEFLISMNIKHKCDLLYETESGFKCSVRVRECEGDLTNRPAWCPLRENKFKDVYHTESGWEG